MRITTEQANRVACTESSKQISQFVYLSNKLLNITQSYACLGKTCKVLERLKKFAGVKKQISSAVSNEGSSCSSWRKIGMGNLSPALAALG